MKQTSQTVFFGLLFDLFTHSSFVRSGVLTSLNLVHFYTWLIEWGVWSEDFMPCKGPRFTPQFDLFFLGEHLFHLLANKMQEFSVFLHTLALWFSTVHWTSYLKPGMWFRHHFRDYCTKKKIEKNLLSTGHMLARRFRRYRIRRIWGAKYKICVSSIFCVSPITRNVGPPSWCNARLFAL